MKSCIHPGSPGQSYITFNPFVQVGRALITNKMPFFLQTRHFHSVNVGTIPRLLQGKNWIFVIKPVPDICIKQTENMKKLEILRIQRIIENLARKQLKSGGGEGSRKFPTLYF